MRLKAAGRPGEDRLNVASGRPYPGTKCEVGIRHFRDSLLTRDGEDSWCRGWESNPHRPEARGILRPRKKGSEQRTWPIRCLFPCPRSPRSAVESEDYGHPDGHLFRRFAVFQRRAGHAAALPPLSEIKVTGTAITEEGLKEAKKFLPFWATV